MGRTAPDLSIRATFRSKFPRPPSAASSSASSADPLSSAQVKGMGSATGVPYIIMHRHVLAAGDTQPQMHPCLRSTACPEPWFHRRPVLRGEEGGGDQEKEEY